VLELAWQCYSSRSLGQPCQARRQARRGRRSALRLRYLAELGRAFGMRLNWGRKQYVRFCAGRMIAAEAAAGWLPVNANAHETSDLAQFRDKPFYTRCGTYHLSSAELPGSTPHNPDLPLLTYSLDIIACTMEIADYDSRLSRKVEFGPKGIS